MTLFLALLIAAIVIAIAAEIESDGHNLAAWGVLVLAAALYLVR